MDMSAKTPTTENPDTEIYIGSHEDSSVYQGVETPSSISHQAIEIVGQKENQVETQKLGRNDLCYCGSGKKYKKCHGK